MKIVILEIGTQSLSDAQHRSEAIDGSLEDYAKKCVAEIEANPNLDFLEAYFMEKGRSWVCDYFSKSMKKTIRHYAMVIEEVNNAPIREIA